MEALSHAGQVSEVIVLALNHRSGLDIAEKLICLANQEQRTVNFKSDLLVIIDRTHYRILSTQNDDCFRRVQGLHNVPIFSDHAVLEPH